MKYFKLFIAVLFATVFLSSCAGLYSQPQNNEPSATIKGSSERKSLTVWSNTSILRIDDKALGLGSSRRVAPGVHKLVVSTEFNDGLFSSGPYQAMADLQFNFQSQKQYTVKSKVAGSKVLFWLVDERGNSVGSPVSTNYAKERLVTYTMPVVVSH